jgi:Methyltransferase FkbM domain
VTTLAAICQRYAPRDIHFLKIDVEGAEQSVLTGADFTTFRPWIVLVEATWPNSQEASHESWESRLIDAGYRFVWFDGLNRFYVAAERYEELHQHFRTPPNVFDNFLRAAEAELARRVTRAENRASAAEAQVVEAARQATRAESRANVAEAQSMEAAHQVASAESRANAAEAQSMEAAYQVARAESRASIAEAQSMEAAHQVARAESRANSAEARAREARRTAEAARKEAARAETARSVEAMRASVALRQVDALYASTSWRITALLRAAVIAFRECKARGPRHVLQQAAHTIRALPHFTFEIPHLHQAARRSSDSQPALKAKTIRLTADGDPIGAQENAAPDTIADLPERARRIHAELRIKFRPAH